MARPENPMKSEVISAIRALAAKLGVKEGCRLARERYPDVPLGSWGRWRQEAVGNVLDQRDTDAAAAAGIVAEVRAEIPAPEQLAAEMADPVPAMRRALDFWRMLDELERDAQLLREFSLTQRPDGTVKVRVPFALRDAHRMRCDLIRLGLQQAEVAYGVGRTAKLQQAIIEAVGEESPECQRRIIFRLKQLQTESESRGF
jgi:hypothetical protein